MKADQSKITRLLKTARGQIDGLLKMVEEDRYCIDVSNQLLATEAILRKVNKEILHSHIGNCVEDIRFAVDDAGYEVTKIENMA